MAKSLMGSLPIYAQHLAEQTGVKVIVQGKQAYTDGEKVVVPFTEDDLPLSFGYIAHECSHVRNSDMDVFKGALPVPFRKNLLNILEDIRIERLSMEQYPGTEDDIRYLNRKVLLEPFKPEHVAQAQPVHIIHNAILFGTYWLLQEPQLEVPAKAYLDALNSLLGEEIAEKIMAEAQNTLKCNNTADVLGIVDAIIELLPSEEEQPQQPEPEPEKGEGEGEQGDPSGAGDMDPAESGGTSGSGDDQSTDSSEGEQDGNSGAQAKDKAGSSEGAEAGQGGEGAGDEGKGDGQPEPKQKSSIENQGESRDSHGSSNQAGAEGKGQQGSAPQNLREQVLNAKADDLKGLISEVGDAAAALLGRKASNEWHPAAPFALAGRAVRRSPEASVRREMLGSEHSAGLRQILNGLLQAKVDCRVRLKRQGKRIDTSRIAMIKGGETRVFRSKARSERSSAAIQFLFDKSSSMDSAMEQAEAAIYAVLRSLEGLPQVTTGAMSFPGSNSSIDGCCDLIKRSHERLGAAIQAGGFGSLAQGGTPLARAIWPAAIEVLRAKGDRKVLFVITDGSPNSGSEGDCREMFERCAASGIEVVGLGFGDANEHTLRRIFEKYVAVGTVSNLKTALFGVVREALTA